MPITPKWQRFERLVAAIHAAQGSGAEVRWNDFIDGRQFDATVRFRHLSYDYLTVIEARDSENDIPIGDVEAFVTKAGGVNANKAVMVASSGFQSGAREVAARHGIELFTLTESTDLPPWILTRAIRPAFNVTDVILEGRKSTDCIALPDSSNALTFHMLHTRFLTGPQAGSSLAEFVEAQRPIFEKDLSREPVPVRLGLPGAPVTLKAPQHKEFSATSLSFVVQIVDCVLVDAKGIDPGILPPTYDFTNALTGEVGQFSGVPLGFDTVLEAGRFYTNPNLGTAYYCERIDGSKAWIALVESYQHGNLWQAKCVQELAYQNQYVLVTEPDEVARLRALYDVMNRPPQRPASPRANPPGSATFSAGRNEPCPCGSGKKFKRCHGARAG